MFRCITHCDAIWKHVQIMTIDILKRCIRICCCFLGKLLQTFDDAQEVVTIERKTTSAPEDTSSYASNNSNNVPRAIRGSGALDKNKPKKDGVTSRLNSCRQNATSNQKPNKGWDHDDRFHKDYE